MRGVHFSEIVIPFGDEPRLFFYSSYQYVNQSTIFKYNFWSWGTKNHVLISPENSKKTLTCCVLRAVVALHWGPLWTLQLFSTAWVIETWKEAMFLVSRMVLGVFALHRSWNEFCLCREWEVVYLYTVSLQNSDVSSNFFTLLHFNKNSMNEHHRW